MNEQSVVGGWDLLKSIGKNPQVLKPLGNYIVVRLFQAQKETMGGIALPDQIVDKDRQCLARVIKAGPGQRALMDGTPMGCHVKDGDLLVILKHAPIEIKLGGEMFHVVAEGDVIAVIDEEELKNIPLDDPEAPVVEPEPESVDPVVQTAGGIWVPRSE